MTGAAALASGVFLAVIQGFGHVIQDSQTWFYSSLKPARLDSIARSGAFLSPSEQATWEDEAKRHLFQRDFYVTNDFLAKDGSYYRDWRRAHGENAILEKWYRPFLEKYGNRTARSFSGSVDRQVGETLGSMSVAWPDSMRLLVTERAGPLESRFTSRVKSTVVTSFSLRHLIRAEIAVLALLAIFWTVLGRRRAPGRPPGNGQAGA